MKTKRFFAILLISALGIAATSALAWAAPAPPTPKKAACSLVGTWAGWADQDWSDPLNSPPSLAWTAVQTEDSPDTSGEILMNWVPNQNDLSGEKGIIYLTPGHGIWQKNGNQYNYTWYAYYVDDNPGDVDTYGSTVASVRVFGTVTFPTDCNHASISYRFEVFEGMVTPDGMTISTPVVITPKADDPPGIAGETKAPLATN